MQRFGDTTEEEQKRALAVIIHVLNQPPYLSSKDKGVIALKKIANDGFIEIAPVRETLERFVKEAHKHQSQASGGILGGVFNKKSNPNHALFNFLAGLNRDRIERLQADSISIGANDNRFNLENIPKATKSQLEVTESLHESLSGETEDALKELEELEVQQSEELHALGILPEKRNKPFTPIGSPREEQEDTRSRAKVLGHSKDTLLATPTVPIDQTMVAFMRQLPNDREMTSMGNSAEGNFKIKLSKMIRHVEQRSLDSLQNLIRDFREAYPSEKSPLIPGFRSVFSIEANQIWRYRDIDKLSKFDAEKIFKEFDKIAHEFRRDNNKRFESRK